MAAVLFGAALLGMAAMVSPPASGTPADPSTDYVRFDLLRYRDRVEGDGSFARTVEVRVLLRTANGVRQFGQIGSPYVDGYGDVAFEKVVIEKPDGHLVEVENGLVQDVNPFGVTETSVAADVRFKKMTIPGLEPGDSLSYRMVLRQKPLVPGRVFGEMKLFGFVGDPTQTYELDLPRDAGIRVRLRDGFGAAWEDVPAAGERLVRRLTHKVERLGGEPGELTKASVQAWAEPDVVFTSFSSWDEVSKWWWALSEDRLKPDASIKAEAQRLVASKTTPRERIVALHGFVASKVRYVNVSFGIGRMQPRPAADVLGNRYGDCKDKHALLAALASAVGLDVRPVLIGTSRSELHDEVPSPQQFDHMISVARLGPQPADWLWLDATNPYGVGGYLGPDLRDKRVLLIEASGEGRIVRTPAEPPFVPRTEVEIKGRLENDGVLRGRVVRRYRSDGEVEFRAIFAATLQDRWAELVRASLASQWKDAKVTNVSVSDPADVTDALRIEFDVESTPSARPAQGDWSLWVPVPEFGLPEPTKKTTLGRAAADIAPGEFLQHAEIEIAEGLIARAPLSVSLDRPFGTFESAYSVEGRRLRLTRKLKLSRQSVSGDELASYEAFRKTIDTDRDQKFSVLGGTGSTAAPLPQAPSLAEALRTQGLASFDQKDYAKAVELLQKATEADVKVKDGFLDLGRALSEAGRNEEALRAFSRQIEISAFHESAYEWRASVLDRLNRWDEAERDLLKQVEVAPFHAWAWAYETLGSRRTWQGRFGEAAEFFARAAAVEPKVGGRWVDVGRAYARDGRPAEARAALDRARSLGLPDSMKISAGAVYEAIGDPGTGGDLATNGLASVAQRLATLSGDVIGTDDLWGAEYLARAWYLIGAAAVATSDVTKAERYLDAAWNLWFLPEAAWALGDLREKQGRLTDAVRLWSMASAVPGPGWRLPADRQGRIDAACRRLDEGLLSTEPDKQPQNVKPSRQLTGETTLMDLRTFRPDGRVLADLSEEVLLLVGADGSVERIRGISTKNAESLDHQLATLGPIRLPISRPDEQAFKVVRRGLLACSRMTRCVVVLDLPDTRAETSQGTPASRLPSDFLLGRWREEEHGFLMDISANSSQFFVREGSSSGEFSYFGDVIAEFSHANESDSYLGRHTWGGRRSNNMSWGKEGGFVIYPYSKKQIRIVYTDSRYTGGWVYDKIGQDRDPEAMRGLPLRSVGGRAAAAVPTVGDLGINLERYCRNHGHPDGARNVDGTGNGWRCEPGSSEVNMGEACREQHGAQFNAVLLTPAPGGAGDWKCRSSVAARARW